MPKIVEINLNGNFVKIYANNNSIVHEKCKILGKVLYCVNIGTTFSSIWISKEILNAAIELGINIESTELWNILQKNQNELKNLIEKKSKSNQDDIQTSVESSNNSNSKSIIVTTGDLKENYQVIGPVYFQVSNKGVFTSDLSRLIKKYSDMLQALKKEGHLHKEKVDWGILYGEFSVGQNDFDKAFFVAVEELKLRAKLVGADAIIGMRQDIDLDTTNIQKFYLQIYGTAVKLLNHSD